LIGVENERDSSQKKIVSQSRHRRYETQSEQKWQNPLIDEIMTVENCAFGIPKPPLINQSVRHQPNKKRHIRKNKKHQLKPCTMEYRHDRRHGQANEPNAPACK
jgi:hypothetical protein